MLMEIKAEPLLFLKTWDRYSGEPTISPVLYRAYGEQFIIVASNETETYKPDWYLNLKEEPIVEIEIGGRGRFAVATTPCGTDRLKIWPLVEALSLEIERHQPRNVTGVLLTPME